MALDARELDSKEADLLAEAQRARSRMEEARMAIEAAEAQLAKLRGAREALVTLGLLEDERRDNPAGLGDADDDATDGDSGAGTQSLRLRDLIMFALNAGDLWQSAVEIREAASQLSDRDVPMSSVSPTLTKLKNDGTVVRDGVKKIALRSRVEIEEPSFLNENGEAEASPDAEGSQAHTLLTLQNSTHAA